jgi:NitT/TauT family transport system substrate-binding protein
MLNVMKKTALAIGLALISTAHAASADNVNVVLNWTPGSDHAPLYWAQKEGLYSAAGIDLSIEIGKGSAFSAQRVGAGTAEVGIVDMPTAIQARGEGVDLVGIMAIYASSPYTIYWKKSRGIQSIKDLAGRKIGTPPADAARLMWPAIAQAAGLEANSVEWVNVAPDAKMAALQSDAIDVTTNFYNLHFVAERVLGDDLGFLKLSEIGFNPYGNSFFVNGAYAKDNADTVKRFVEVTQKAYASCVVEPDPCLQVVADTASQDIGDLQNGWKLVVELMQTKENDQPLGYFVPERLAKDYEVVEAAFGTKPYDYNMIFTNAYLDPAVKLSPAGN